MSAMLKGTAVASVNKGLPSSFYPKDRPNPVFQALEQEIKLYTGYMRKRISRNYKKPKDEPFSRP